MTTLLERPASIERPPGGGSDARRAIVRWAWRLFRREWRQQVLALALLLVAVSATVVGLGVVSNVQSSDDGTFGTANTRFDISSSSASHLAADIAKAQQTLGPLDVIEHGTVPVPGSVNPIDLRDQSPTGRYGRPMLRLVSGHYPVGPAEIAITRGVATTFGVRLGSTWTVNGQASQVVGIVENPNNLQDDFALVAPGQISAPASVTILTDANRAQIQSFRPKYDDPTSVGTTGTSGPKQRQQQSLAVLLLATIGLMFVGLLSVAGFTVMAQRRMRALGMIGAIGATDRQVRLVMISNGAAVGAAGSLAGAVLGLGAWFALVPAFEHLVGHRIDPFAMQWWAIAAVVALAIVTAVLAAWWPARAVTRTPIVAALSGRPARPQPAHRFAALGTALVATGFVLLVLGHQQHTLLIVGGIVLTTAGMLLLAPLGIRALASAGRRSPIAIRLALRDLARYQARSGAALAAVSLAVGIAATIAITASAQAAANRATTGGNLPANQLAVWISGPPGPNGPAGKTAEANAGPIATADQLAHLQISVDALASALHAGSALSLGVALNTHAETSPGGSPDFDVVLVRAIGRNSYTFVGIPLIATSALLDFYRVPAAAWVGADILTGRADLVGAVILDGDNRRPQVPTIGVRPQLPTYSSAPNTLITPQYASSLGLIDRPVGWLIQTPHPLTAAQIASARQAAAAAGMTIETRTAQDRSLQHLRDYSTAVGVLVALGVLAMTVGLIRSETANDLRTLSAAGASTRTRRTLTAATAGALGLLGGVLGTAGAYLALVAWHWHAVSYLGHPPYLDLAILVFGLAVAAIVGGWVSAWRAPAGIAHRPME